MTKRSAGNRPERGFTFIELMIVVALAGVVLAASYPVVVSTIEHYETESALQLVLTNIRKTRQDALDGRRALRIVFNSDGGLTVWRQDASFSWEQDRQLSLPESMAFVLPSGVPRIGIVPHTSDIDFGGSNTVRFQADGSAVDSSGQIVSGIIYMSHSGRAESTRAVTVFGGTGLTRGWVFENGRWK